MSNRYNGVLPLDHRLYKDEDHKAVDAGIDALAVMDELAEGTTLMTRVQCGRVREARAAVAELIEASSAYLAGEYWDDEAEWNVNYQARRRRERDRFATALARARGEA